MSRDPKRPRAIGVALLLTILFTGCAPRFQSGSDSFAIARSGLLFLHTARDLVTLSFDGDRVASVDLPVVSSPGWSRLFTTLTESGATRVVAIEPESGRRRPMAMIQGDLEPAVVTQDGHTVALSSRRELGGGPWVAEPREQTDIAIVRPDGSERRFSLQGNFQPEAFSADAHRLFMIEYIPATAPDRYRVRQLDLASGVISPIGGRLKQPAPEEMKGVGRTQVLSPDGSTLYTLYTRQVESYPHGRPENPAHDATSPVHSFVHVLNLEAGWAHCVDLPHPFGMSSTDDDALAISRDGRNIYVADGSAGSVAAIDTQQLRVVRTAEFEKSDDRKIALQASDDGTLFLATGYKVLLIDGETLARRKEMQLPMPTSGAILTPDDSTLFLVIPDGILKISASSGRIIRRFVMPGMVSIVGIKGG